MILESSALELRNPPVDLDRAASQHISWILYPAYPKRHVSNGEHSSNR